MQCSYKANLKETEVLVKLLGNANGKLSKIVGKPNACVRNGKLRDNRIFSPLRIYHFLSAVGLLRFSFNFFTKLCLACITKWTLVPVDDVHCKVPLYFKFVIQLLNSFAC